MAVKDITTKTYVIHREDYCYSLKTELSFPKPFFFKDKLYDSLLVSTYVDYERNSAKTMVSAYRKAFLETSEKHSLADALIKHIEAVENLKSIYTSKETELSLRTEQDLQIPT